MPVRRCDPSSAPPGVVGEGRPRLPGRVLPCMGIALALYVCVALVSERQGLRAQAQQQQRVAIRIAPMTQAKPASNTRLVIQIDRAKQSRPRASSVFAACPRRLPSPRVTSLLQGPGRSAGGLAQPRHRPPGRTAGAVGHCDQPGERRRHHTCGGENGAGCRRCPACPAPTRAAVPRCGRHGSMLAPAELERALGLHAKGQEQLARGDIYAARRFFERAAEIGWRRARSHSRILTIPTN